MNEREIFVACLESGDDAERAAVLEQACLGNHELRAQIEMMLQEHKQLGSFLESPALPGRIAWSGGLVGDDPGTLIGPYKLLQKIGEGGMGTVYMAEQERPVRRLVALKVIKPGMDSALVLARFEAERQALALMDHQNIARVLDGGTTESGRPYFVMELVKGLPITEYCDANKLTYRDRLVLFVQVCHAIQHAHHKGIVHRDIKPSNVMVTLYDGKPVPKVIDFGVAKAIEQRLTDRTLFTAHGQIVGTWEYMSPEQTAYSGLDVDTRCDIYSLGVLVYELLTGTTPLERSSFRGAAYDEILRLIREQEAPRPSVRLSDSGDRLATISARRQTEPARLKRLLRGELDWIVMRALEKDRTRRYETPNDLARDVERYLNDEPVEACAPSKRYRLWKFLRRNRVPAVAASVVFLSLVASIIGTTWGMLKAENAHAEEVVQRRHAESSEREAQVEKAIAITATEQERQARIRETAQKQLAEANEKKAVAARQVSEGVLTFLLRDLLRQADPIEQADTNRLLSSKFETKENPTIKELLERAAAELTPANIDTRFPGQREAQAAVLQAVGDSYRGIGEYAKSAEYLTRAVDLFRAELGNDHVFTLSAMERLAITCRYTGKLTQAIELATQVSDGYLKLHGPENQNYLSSLAGLALVQLDAGRPLQGIQLLEKVREAYSTQLDIDDPAYLSLLNNLASAYSALKKLPQAIAILEQVRSVVVEQLGIEHPHTLTALNNLALAYQEVGKLPQAIELLEQVRDIRSKKFGPEHPATLLSMNNLGVAYRDGGRLPQAIDLLEKARTGRANKLGPEHPSTLSTLANLGRAYQLDGKPDQALPLFQQAAQGMEKRKFQDGLAQPVLLRLIGCYDQMEKYAESEIWRRKLLAYLEQRSGTGTAPYAANLGALGNNLLHQKKWLEAEQALRASVACLERLQSASDQGQSPPWALPLARSRLGSALAGRKLFVEAEQLLLGAVEELQTRQAQLPPSGRSTLTESIERLIQLYDAWDRKDHAAQWRKKLTEMGAVK